MGRVGERYDSIGALAKDMASRVGAESDVTFEFSSYAADEINANGAFNMLSREIELSTQTSKRLVGVMENVKNSDTWNGLNSLMHELGHSKSMYGKLLREGAALPDWAAYWEEGVVEARARSQTTALMFGNKAPTWTTSASRSYNTEVLRMKWLESRGVNLEAFFKASPLERLEAVNVVAREAAEELLLSKAFKASEIRELFMKLGDEVQHLVRLGKLVPSGWGTMTRRQILNDLRVNWGITSLKGASAADTLGDLINELSRARRREDFTDLKERAGHLDADDRASFMEAWAMHASARGVWPPS